MGSVKEYFSSLGSGVVSLLKGMQVTGKEFITPKITECYPENRQEHQWPERFRAILRFTEDGGRHKCIACGSCERACPNGTITLTSKMEEGEGGAKRKVLDKYSYNLGSCTFCQLCVTSCPTGAIYFSNDFEQAVFTRGKLVKELNAGLEPPLPPKRPAAAPKPAAAAAPAVKVDIDMAAIEAQAKAKAGGDPEKEAKLREALIKAATLKAQREAAKAASEGATPTNENK